MGKGDVSEREAVNRLEDELGWRALRAPSSGGGTDRERPDVLAGRNGRTIVLELKTSGGRPIYIGKDEIEALQAFADDFGAEAYIACRWKSRELQDKTIYCAHPSELHETENNRRAKYEDMVTEAWTPLSVLCG